MVDDAAVETTLPVVTNEGVVVAILDVVFFGICRGSWSDVFRRCFTGGYANCCRIDTNAGARTSLVVTFRKR